MAARVHAWQGCGSPSSDEFDDDSWYQQTHLDLLFKMVPSISDESGQIIGTHFSVKIESLQDYLTQMEPYFEVTISNSHSWRKILSNDILFAYV